MPVNVGKPNILERHWPLFGLRLETEHLVMRVGRDEDFEQAIRLIDDGIHDPAVMPFRFPFTDAVKPERDWNSLRYWWSTRASFQPLAWNLEFFVFHDDELIGIQSMVTEKFALLREGHSGSWLGARFQRKGFGFEMRSALLEFAFEHLEAKAMLSEAFTDNLASNGVSTKLGYELDGIDTVAPRGTAVTSQRFRLSRDRWKPTNNIVVTGLQPCRVLLGLGD